MPATGFVLVLAAAIVVLGALAVLLVAALLGRGPLHRNPAGPEGGLERAERADEAYRVPLDSRVRLVAREPRATTRESGLRRDLRPSEEELDDILAGSLAAEAYNKTVRVIVWAFILSVSVIASATEVWQNVQPQIFVTLALGGIFVLVVHEIMPPGGLGPLRFMLEGTAAIVFLTMLVLLTGKADSPFFFLFPVLVGGAALVSAPSITLLLTIESAAAYVVATTSMPAAATAAPDFFARVGINMTALLLLAYAGMVVSRVQRKTREAAVRLSTVDALTDLYNRAYFFTAVDREIQRSRRFRRSFCLLMMDLDGLKAINDRFGHYQGDLVLRGAAETIRGGLRSIDVASRYGGDEFVALLPETDPSGAYVVAEKIRQGVSDLLVEAAGQRIATSLSIGVVAYPEDGQTADELMIAADEAMYSSKRLGKNRVVGFAEPASGTPVQPDTILHRPPVSTPGFRPLPRNGEDRGG